MTVLEYLKHIGKHDDAVTQFIYALALFLVLNTVLAITIIWPLHVNQIAISEAVQKHQQQSIQNDLLINQSEELESRYNAMIFERKTDLTCNWVLGKEIDTIDLNFEQARGCLEAWIQNNHHNMTEMTFYKNGKVRTIEVMHD